MDHPELSQTVKAIDVDALKVEADVVQEAHALDKSFVAFLCGNAAHCAIFAGIVALFAGIVGILIGKQLH